LSGYVPYRPRRVSFRGVRVREGYSIKMYTIVHDDSPLVAEHFADGLALARAELPQPPNADGRPGVGFLILHQGRGVDYVVLAWWDRENELPLRIFIRDETAWRPARGGESVCVWDLRVIWHEREAYVSTVLSGRDGAIDDYLARSLEGWA